jgi:hypothetical protein
VWTGSDLRTITVRADVTEELGSEVNVLFMIDAPPVETDETIAASEQEEEGEFASPTNDGPSSVPESTLARRADRDRRCACRSILDVPLLRSADRLAITPERARAATA